MQSEMGFLRKFEWDKQDCFWVMMSVTVNQSRIVAQK